MSLTLGRSGGFRRGRGARRGTGLGDREVFVPPPYGDDVIGVLNLVRPDVDAFTSGRSR